jgi:hypothetical protein
MAALFTSPEGAIQNAGRFSMNRTEFSENCDWFFMIRRRFMENAGQFSMNRTEFSENCDRFFMIRRQFTENAGQFFMNQTEFLENCGRFSLIRRVIMMKRRRFPLSRTGVSAGGRGGQRPSSPAPKGRSRKAWGVSPR